MNALVPYQNIIGDTASDWYVEGTMYDKNGNTLFGVTIQIVLNATLQPVTVPFKLPGATYSAWTDDPFVHSVLFKCKGYKDKKIQIATLYELMTTSDNGQADVIMEKAGEIPVWAIALVLTAVIAYKKKKKKVSGFLSTGDILPIFLLVGGVIGFDVIKKILEKLGFWNSADTKELDNAQDDPDSFWSPLFWQQKPPNTPWSYAITESTAKQWCEDIRDNFAWYNDNEEAVIGIFKQCRTQSNCSFLAYIFQKYYGEDLLPYLRGGNWPQDRLSDADVNIINRYIKNLPKY